MEMPCTDTCEIVCEVVVDQQQIQRLAAIFFTGRVCVGGGGGASPLVSFLLPMYTLLLTLESVVRLKVKNIFSFSLALFCPGALEVVHRLPRRSHQLILIRWPFVEGYKINIDLPLWVVKSPLGFKKESRRLIYFLN